MEKKIIPGHYFTHPGAPLETDYFLVWPELDDVADCHGTCRVGRWIERESPGLTRSYCWVCVVGEATTTLTALVQKG